MTDTDIVIEPGGYPGGWLDTITNFEFPSTVAVLTFNVSWTGDSQSGSNVPYADKPTITISGQGGGTQASVLSGGTQMLNKAIAFAAFPPFSKQDESTIPTPQFWDYTTATFIYGIRGNAYPSGSGQFSGANGAECFNNAVEAFVSILMSEFSWDRATAIGNLVGVVPIYDFFVLMGLIDSTPVPPPGRNPTEPQPPFGLCDSQGVVVLRGGEPNNIIQDWRNFAFVIPISSYKGTGQTISISMNIAKPPHGNTYTWVAGVAIYTKAQKGWQKAPPSGWNIGPQTYPTYAGYPWHQVKGYDKPLLRAAKGSVDTQELHDLSGGATAGRTIKFTIDATSLGITPSG